MIVIIIILLLTPVDAKKCKKHEWTCNTKTCINYSDKCDGVVNCEDGSDELACPISLPICPIGIHNNFYCTDFSACIPDAYRCNNFDDCEDGSDESSELCNTKISTTITSSSSTTISSSSSTTISSSSSTTISSSTRTNQTILNTSITVSIYNTRTSSTTVSVSTNQSIYTNLTSFTNISSYNSYISSSTNFSPNLSINNFTKLDKNVNTNVDDSKGYIYIIISIVVILIVIGIFLIIKKKNNIGNDSKFEINENFDSQYMEPTVLKDELYEPINNYETII